MNPIFSWNTQDFNQQARSWIMAEYKEQLGSGCIELHHGDSTDILKTFPNNYFDWVYLDTDHTYNTTKKELEHCKDKVKKGGIIAGHDYTIYNYRKKYKYGVVEAVNEFCYKHNWEFICLTHETHRHISFAIKEIL